MARRTKKKQKRIRKKGSRVRSPWAVIAKLRSGSGRHANRRNLARKQACRGKVQQDTE